MIFPIGLEDGAVHRVPWINILIAAATIGVFVYSSTRGGGAELERGINDVVEYWQERPYLELPPAFSKRYLPDGVVTLAREAKQAAERAGQVPKPSVVELEQEQLEELSRRAMTLQRANLFDRWALVPAKGFAQLGLLAHLFLHSGLLHLLGNLFFLYLVGPFLEDIWGRPFFLVFYLAGGVVAGLAQAGLDGASTVPIVGASGAIAACMGAFAFRFATRKVRFFYWFLFVLVGTFSLPAWLWAGIWFAREVAAFKLVGADAGVAFMAHIGGFVFGLFAAVLVRLARLETDVLQPGLARQRGEWQQHPGVARALELRGRGDTAAARQSLEKVLRDDPANVDAGLGLFDLRQQAGDHAGASRVVGGVVQALLGKNAADGLAAIAEQAGEQLDPSTWRPAVAWRAAQTWLAGHPRLARRCLEAAASDPGLAGKALVQAAELSLERLRNPEEGRALAERALALTLPAELKGRAQAALAAAAGQGLSGREGATIGRGEALGSLPVLELSVEAPAPVDVGGAGVTRAGDVELDLGFGPGGADARRGGLELGEVGATPAVGAPVTAGELEIDFEAAGVARPTPAPAPAAPSLPPAVQVLPAPQPTPAPVRPPTPAPAPAAPPREVIAVGKPTFDVCRFAGRFADGYVIQLSQGAKVNLSYGLIRGVAVGVVAGVPGRTGKVMVIDLVLAPRQGSLRILRLFSDALGLDTLFPSGTAPAEALKALLVGLLEKSPARPAAQREQLLRGEYPRYDSLAAFEAAVYR